IIIPPALCAGPSTGDNQSPPPRERVRVRGPPRIDVCTVCAPRYGENWTGPSRPTQDDVPDVHLCFQGPRVVREATGPGSPHPNPLPWGEGTGRLPKVHRTSFSRSRAPTSHRSV